MTNGEIGSPPYPQAPYYYVGRCLTDLNACVTCHAGHQIGAAAASQYIDEAELPQQCERCHQQLR